MTQEQHKAISDENHNAVRSAYGKRGIAHSHVMISVAVRPEDMPEGSRATYDSETGLIASYHYGGFEDVHVFANVEKENGNEAI